MTGDLQEFREAYNRFYRGYYSDSIFISIIHYFRHSGKNHVSWPGFFVQERVGYKENIFNILKLRIMKHGDRNAGEQVRPDEIDITRVGGVLRRLKIDELPQLSNVVSGDMSLVGPRPCLIKTYIDMSEWARARIDVGPGITGLAQTSGNIALPWTERWKFDVRYVERLSATLDIYILLKTIFVVILGEDRFWRSTRSWS